MTLDNYSDKLHIGGLTCAQSIFIADETQNYWPSISSDLQYIVWVKFKTPIERRFFLEKYGWILDNNISRPKRCGISWIPIKTSDNPDDVCLGMAGNLSFHHLSQYSIFSEKDLYNMDLLEREMLFDNSIKFLLENSRETDLFVNTDLWANADTIDFISRYEYIQNNGFQYLGFVAYMNGSDILNLESDLVDIVDLKEDN